MGCQKLTYDQWKETTPFLGVWEEGDYEKLPFLKGACLAKKGVGLKKRDNYYPFGLNISALSSTAPLSKPNKFKFQGQEEQTDFDLGWYSFKWRNHDPTIGRFFNVDPLDDQYVYHSPYAFSENHVTVHVELEGLEKVYIFDQASNPNNKRTYTSDIYVMSNNMKVFGPYRGSTFPNSATKHNTVNAGTHEFNNESGHKSGTQKGLNIVDATGNRVAPGTNPDGEGKKMTVVNIHSGVNPDDNNGLQNRGSAGCPTCHPDDAADLFSLFDFSVDNSNTGNAEGTITIFRGDSNDSKNMKDFLLFLQDFSENVPAKSDNTRVAPKLISHIKEDDNDQE
jgi:RHS repeat-associated protein